LFSLLLGEEKKVQIPIVVNDLSWYDENEKGWKLGSGEYTLRIGSSSRDIRLEKKVEIK